MIRTLSVVALCMVGAVAAAQTSSHQGRHLMLDVPAGEQHLERLALLLDLDEYQKGEVRRILDEQHQQRMALRRQHQAAPERSDTEQIRAEHERLNQETLAKLQPVLTDIQLQKYQALVPQEVRIKRRH